ILTVSHRVVREHEDRGQFHEGGQTNCGTRVIAEYEERRTKGSQLRQCEAVNDCSHCVLANAKVQGFSLRSIGLKISCPGIGEESLVGRTKVGGAAEEPGNILRQHIQRFARRIATGDALRVGRKYGQVAVPSCWKLSLLHQLNFNCELWISSAVRLK